MAWKDTIRERNYEALTEVIAGLLESRVGRCSSLLDVGCGDGRKTVAWAARMGVPPGGIAGVEGYGLFREKASALFRVEDADLEADRLPFSDGAFDLVIANQVMEHIKNIFHLMGELCRVTRPGGHLLLSVPNLASAHNRILLTLGRQPTPIKIFCEHVRGFTSRSLAELALASGDFCQVARSGSGFYPLPPGPGNALASIWPGGAVYAVLLLRRQSEVDPGYWVRWASSTQDTRWTAEAPVSPSRTEARS